MLAGVVILGTIMTVLDLIIVNVAIPTLARDLGASIPSIQWVITGYMLAFATVIPLTGWAAERFGARRAWIFALLVFLAGSVLAGAAWSLGSLIAFRVPQGLGAGMILPIGQTILAQAAGPQRRTAGRLRPRDPSMGNGGGCAGARVNREAANGGNSVVDSGYVVD